jgi:hypothetical protein
MLRYERRWIVVVFDYQDWRDMVHAGYALYVSAMLLCEWLWPGWAASVGISPHVDWWHPNTWLHTMWRHRL